MKWIKQTRLAVVLAVGALSAHAAPTIDEPAVMSEAMLSITVSDLHGLIDEVGLVAAQVSPMINGMMLKSILGMQLGDPNLSGIALGKGLAVVALDPTNIFSVIEVSEAQSGLYASTTAAKNIQSAYTNGVLVLAATDEALAKGIGMSGTVQSELLTKRSPTLRIAGQPSSIVERNNEQIMGFVQMLPQLMGAGMMQTPGTDTNSVDTITKILEGEARVLLSLASQCETFEVVLAPQNGSIKISETYVPKAGTRLATLGNSPKTSNENPRLQAGMLGEGMLLFDFVIANPEALATFFVTELEQLFVDMKLEDIDLSSVSASMTKWMTVYKGAGCETFDFDVDDGMSMNYLREVTDEAAALELFKTLNQDIAPLLELYKGLGIEMNLTFKENEREYNGIKIHELEMKVAMDELSEEQREQMEAMDMDDMEYEIAIFDGMVLFVMGEVEIEKIIDRVQNSDITVVPVEARSVYPAGGFYYADFDIGRYIDFVSAMVSAGTPSPIDPQVVVMLQGVDPITSAGFRDAGRVMWSINIPGDLIGKLGQIGMMMQMQNMQQQQMQQSQPAGMPMP